MDNIKLGIVLTEKASSLTQGWTGPDIEGKGDYKHGPY